MVSDVQTLEDARPRLLWHPEVHAELGERCFIYLLSSPAGDGSAIIDALKGLFERLEISSPILHVVFGQHDVLVRMWLDDHRRQRFLRALKSPASNPEISRYSEFAADEVIYTWVNSPSPRTDKIREARTRGLLTYAINATREADVPASLWQDGLLVRNPANQGCKFYMFFNSEDYRMRIPDSAAMQTILDAAINSGVEDVTLHQGAGFCECVLKGVVAAYEEVLPSVEVLQKIAPTLHMKAWTIVPADRFRYPDGEGLDVIREKPAPEDLLETLRAYADGAHIRREIDTLSEEDRDALIRIFKRYQGRLADAEFTRFAEILAYSVTLDRSKLNRSLSFLTSIETDLRWLLPRMLAKYLGRDWVAQVRGDSYIAERISEEKLGLAGERFEIVRWGLFDLALMLNTVLHRWPNLREGLGKYTNASAIRDVTALSDLRNDFAHGRIVEMAGSRTYASEWGEHLTLIASAIGFQVGLEAYRNELSGQDV